MPVPAVSGPPEPFSDAESDFLVRLPSLPESPARPAFPLFALTAPLVASAVMFAVTSSPFALIFAVFGPLLALAAVGDARRTSRRARRDSEALYRHGFGSARARVDALHSAERQDLHRTWPHPAELAAIRPESLGDGTPCLARIGCGTVVSRVRVDGGGRDDGEASAGVRGSYSSRRTDLPRLDQLRAMAGRLTNAPLVVDFSGGVALQGTAAPARAALRSCILQLAWRFDPATVSIRWTEHPELDWLTRLPHARLPTRPLEGGLDEDLDGDLIVEFVAALGRSPSIGADSVRAGVVHAGVAALPIPGTEVSAVLARLVCRRATTGPSSRCATVVEFSAGTAVMSRRSSDPIRLPVECDLVSTADAMSLADSLAAHRRRSEGRPDAPPTMVAWGDIPRAARDGGAAPGRRSLACPIGATAGGVVVTVDLVRDGPHAVIAGTTGSGKSELLVSWVLGLAHAHPPSEVTMLLVDFKGGATFGPLSALPHSVGVVTDLDGASARRAVESLRAEVLFRERALAAAAVSTIGALPDGVALPRLLIVVDEFAALGTAAPELLPVFAAIAARGRSLGMHLLLGTQRASGAVSDDLLSNCAVRVALRLSSSADSSLLIGVATACELPRIPGRALLSVGGESPVQLQVPLAHQGDVVGAAARWPRESLRRPWREPLPEAVGVEDLPATDAPGLAFGLTDLPAEQCYRAAIWHPPTDGALLVVGASGAGRTTALCAIIRSAVARSPTARVWWLPPTPPDAWDMLHRIIGILEGGGCPGTLVVDDVDLLRVALRAGSSGALRGHPRAGDSGGWRDGPRGGGLDPPVGSGPATGRCGVRGAPRAPPVVTTRCPDPR